MASTGRTALVTGASRGIGPYIARSLAEAGYNLVLAARSGTELEAVAQELRASGSAALAVATDLTDPGDLQLLVGAAEREFGHVDVLVNNAGGDPQREFDEMLPGMLQRHSGHVVSVSSLAGRIGFPYTEAYAGAKDGLVGFTRVLRNDYRGRGVSASVLVLGAIRDAGQGQRTSDELGLKIPRFSTSPAGAVGRAVLTAIRKDRAEIVVMPGPGRLLKALLDLFPAMGPAMNELAGASTTMRKVIDHRVEHERNSPPAS